MGMHKGREAQKLFDKQGWLQFIEKDEEKKSHICTGEKAIAINTNIK